MTTTNEHEKNLTAEQRKRLSDLETVLGHAELAARIVDGIRGLSQARQELERASGAVKQEIEVLRASAVPLRLGDTITVRRRWTSEKPEEMKLVSVGREYFATERGRSFRRDNGDNQNFCIGPGDLARIARWFDKNGKPVKS